MLTPPAERNIRLFYLHEFLTDFRFQQAFIAIYLSHILGSYTAGMSIMALEKISSALFDIPTGVMSDTYGRRKTLIVGSLAMVLGVSCYAYAQSYPLLIAGAVLHGLAHCLFNGNNTAYLFEILKSNQAEDEFHHFHGQISSMSQLALGISAAASSLLTPFGLQFVFMMGVLPQIAGVVTALKFDEPTFHEHKERQSLRHMVVAAQHIIQNPKLRLVIIGRLFTSGVGEAVFHFRNVFIGMLWPLWAMGIYRSINNVGGAAGFWFSGKLIDRYTSPVILLVSEIYWTLMEAAAALMANIFSPLLYMTGATMWGPSMVALEKLMQDEFTDSQRATMGSVATFASSMMYALTALLLGIVSDHFGVKAAILFGIVIGVPALPAYWIVFHPRAKG